MVLHAPCSSCRLCHTRVRYRRTKGRKHLLLRLAPNCIPGIGDGTPQPLDDPPAGELGQPSSWPGAYLSQLYAFDLFAGNWDRSIQNFLLQNEGFTRRLCVFDFASCSLEGLAAIKFPVASDPTVRIGKFLRLRHGFFPKAAIEMIDRLAAIPAETITRFLSLMPDDWMSAEQKESICELWSKHQIASRLAALRSGLGDESLL